MARAWLLFIAACWTGPVAEPVAEDAPPKRTDKSVDLAITYRRTGCFGQCPAFEVSIKSDGTLHYIGNQYVAMMGAQTKKLTQRQMRALEQTIDRTKFFTLDEYGNEPQDQSCHKPGGGTCSFSFSICTDTPHTVIAVTRPKRGGSHTIDDAHCSDNRPSEAIERAIDGLVKPWVGQ